MHLKEDIAVNGRLKIYKKEDGIFQLLHDDSNVITDVFRENLAKIVHSSDDPDGELLNNITPSEMWFDSEGSEQTSTGESVYMPSPADRITNTSDPDFYSQVIDDKIITEHPNIIQVHLHIIKENANDKTLSRAMLRSVNGSPIAVKCFESILKKETWELYFDWSIAF